MIVIISRNKKQTNNKKKNQQQQTNKQTKQKTKQNKKKNNNKKRVIDTNIRGDQVLNLWDSFMYVSLQLNCAHFNLLFPIREVAFQ